MATATTEALAQESAVDVNADEPVGIAGLVEKAQVNRGNVAMGIGALVGGASFALLNKKMATNRAIIVGLVLAVVAYVGALRVLPSATATNYQV